MYITNCLVQEACLPYVVQIIHSVWGLGRVAISNFVDIKGNGREKYFFHAGKHV